MTKSRLGNLIHGRSPKLPDDVRIEREKLADRAVKVLSKLGIPVQREEFGFRGGTGDDAWFVTLSDLSRYLLVVRDHTGQRVVLPRRSPMEIQRTINTLGFAEDGWPIQERAEAVVDLTEAMWSPVKVGSG